MNLRRITSVLAVAASFPAVAGLVASAPEAGASVASTAKLQPGTLYVTDTDPQPGFYEVTTINTATNLPEKPIKVAEPPRFIAVTPNGRTAYVGSVAAVIPINVANNKPSKAIRTITAFTIAITPNGKTAYAVGLTGAVTPITTATNKPGRTLTLTRCAEADNAPHLLPFWPTMAITPNGETAYVTCPGSDTVIPIDIGEHNKVERAIKVGSVPSALAITPDGHDVYVTDEGTSAKPDDKVSVISTARNTVTKTITTGSQPEAIAITKNGATVYVAGANSKGLPTLTFISTAKNIGRTSLLPGGGSLPEAVVMTPTGKMAYVLTNGYVFGFAADTGKLKQTIMLPGPVLDEDTPDPMVITPNGATGYVLLASAPATAAWFSTASGRLGSYVDTVGSGAYAMAAASH
jgi:YVTN family beta-propeller protein